VCCEHTTKVESSRFCGLAGAVPIETDVSECDIIVRNTNVNEYSFYRQYIRVRGDKHMLGNKEDIPCAKKDECPGATIEDVLSEIQEIDVSRQKRLEPDEILTVIQYKVNPEDTPKGACSGGSTGPTTIYGLAHINNLIGLAFSGGGIRSATFNLGILQGLAELGILRFIDYLSIVSGGGYIGSWLAAWISRNGSVKDVEKKLSPPA